MPTPLRQPSFIRVENREMPIGECGLSITPNAGRTGLLHGWRRYHGLGLWADPADDGFPRLVVTDVELHVKGDVLAALNGLRIDQNLDDGDTRRHDLPWIRPGSMVGMAAMVFEAGWHNLPAHPACATTLLL